MVDIFVKYHIMNNGALFYIHWKENEWELQLMFLTSVSNQEFLNNMEAIGLKHEVIKKKDVLIKINLSGRYIKNYPGTDMILLRTVVNYIYQNGGRFYGVSIMFLITDF